VSKFCVTSLKAFGYSGNPPENASYRSERLVHLLDRAQEQADRVHTRSLSKQKESRNRFVQRNMRAAFSQGKVEYSESIADRLMSLIDEFGITYIPDHTLSWTEHHLVF